MTWALFISGCIVVGYIIGCLGDLAEVSSWYRALACVAAGVMLMSIKIELDELKK